MKQKQNQPGNNEAALNNELRATEGDFLSAAGLPNRPWFKHTVYAPGEYTGYAAVVIPGVNEAIDAKDAARAQSQLTVLTEAINRAADTLEKAAKN
jgi:N-acetylated-alpha-linked acidic dipeptidase